MPTSQIYSHSIYLDWDKIISVLGMWKDAQSFPLLKHFALALFFKFTGSEALFFSSYLFTGGPCFVFHGLKVQG